MTLPVSLPPIDGECRPPRPPAVVLIPFSDDDTPRILEMLAHPQLRERIFDRKERRVTYAQACEQWTFTSRADIVRWTVRERLGGPAVGCLLIEDGTLAYFICPTRWACGLGSGALARLVQDGHAPPNLEAIVERDNVASRRMLERCGFRFVGLHHRGPRASTCLKYKLNP